MSEQVKKTSFKDRLSRSFRDMRGEMKKVVWPSKKQIVNNTAITLTFIFICGVFVWGIDTILSVIIGLFIDLI